MRRSDVIYTIEQCRQSCEATNYMQLMMILAMAMGHTVGRPVMRMGGGTYSYGAAMRAAVCISLREKSDYLQKSVSVQKCRICRILASIPKDWRNYMSNGNPLPRMMTIREIAQTGLLSEYALRLMHKQGKLPSITVGKKVLINFDVLLGQLQNLNGDCAEKNHVLY